MYSMNCSYLLSAFLLSVPLLPHICCLHSGFWVFFFKQISQTVNTEKRHFSCESDHHFIFQFIKEQQPSYLRWGFPQFQRRFSSVSSHFSGATIRLCLPGKVSTLALKRGLKILLTNRSRHGCSVRPILTTNLKEEKFNLKLNGLTYSLHHQNHRNCIPLFYFTFFWIALIVFVRMTLYLEK